MNILFSSFHFIHLFIIITSHTNYSNEKICSMKNKYMDIFIDVIIPISMALDDGYIYPTIVSITSIMINSNKNTKYIFYIMHPTEFKIENKNKLKSLEKKYKCIINLIDMEGEYNDAWISGHITTPAYYRLSLPILLSDIDKILWLDGDTLIFTDLKEMYDINMEGYYFKGFLDTEPDDVDSFNIENDHPICSGIMLVNLDELRKDDILNKIHKFMNENREILTKKKHDQTLINVVCYRKIGILPPKFGIFNTINSFHRIYNLCNKIYRYKNKYTEEELIDAYYNPAILHFTAKPWKIEKKVFHQDLWWEYAKKTDYFDEIIQNYNYTIINNNF